MLQTFTLLAGVPSRDTWQLVGRASKVHVLILEGQENWGYGGGSNPVMQLAAYYARMLQANWDTLFVTNTLVPAVGAEVFGHGLRSVTYLLCGTTCVTLFAFIVPMSISSIMPAVCQACYRLLR